MTITKNPFDPAQAKDKPAENNSTGSIGDPLWTVEDVAEYLKLQPETIRSMARRGELPALKIGKVWRFQRGAIHAMLVKMC